MRFTADGAGHPAGEKCGSLETVTKRVYGTMKDIAEADKGVLGNCGIVQLHYEDGNFTVEQVVNPN